jgi:hypothetical protein
MPTIPTYDIEKFLATLPPRLEIPRACEISGDCRSQMYVKAGQGRVRFVKDGRKTLVDTASLIADMMSLPGASISPPPPKDRGREQPPSSVQSTEKTPSMLRAAVSSSSARPRRRKARQVEEAAP